MRTTNKRILAHVIALAMLTLAACADTPAPNSSLPEPVPPLRVEAPSSSATETALTVDEAEQALSEQLAEKCGFVIGDDYLEGGGTGAHSVMGVECYTFAWRNGQRWEGIQDRLQGDYAISVSGDEFFYYDRGKDAWFEGVGEQVEIPPENRVSAITPANGERIRERKAENADVVGWLTVPGTDVDSVIVLGKAGDNGFYTEHDFYGNPSKDGTYFADMRCDFSSPTREGIPQNITLYGHNWDENPDGRLFAQLKRYKDKAFAEAHPYIFFSTEEEDMAYEVFAVCDFPTKLSYIIPDHPWEALDEILNLAYEASIYDYHVNLTEADKILTLSTCSFNVPGREPLPLDEFPDYRFVVMARLTSPDEARKEKASLTVNEDILPPDDMPAIYSHHADMIMFGGVLYHNMAKTNHSDRIPEIDLSSLIPAGEVKRSGVIKELRDFDATKLPEGTPLYRIPGYGNMLVAKSGDEMLVYDC